MTKYNHAEFSLESNKRIPVTDEERRLIDEAVAAGKVQKIPTGKSAFDEEYIWGKMKNGHFDLVLKNPMSNAERIQKIKDYTFRRHRQTPPAVMRRRAEVLRLSREGFTAKVIAEFLGCSLNKVKNDRVYWQDKGELPKLTSSSGLTQDDIQQRRAKVLEMINAGMIGKEIAAKLGCGIGAIYNDRLALRAEGKL